MNTSQNKYIMKPPKYLSGLEKLELYGEKKTVPAKHILARTEDRIEFCYIIKKGCIAECEYLKDGETRVYFYSGEGTLIMEEYLLSEQICTVEYETTCQTELIQISRERLFQAVAENPEIMKAVMRVMAEKMMIYEQRLRSEKKQSAEWKLCSLLLDFARCYGIKENGTVKIKEKISQKQMADILGMNRITTVREMKKLKDKMLVDKIGQYYCILDIDGLKECQSSGM